MSRRNIGATVRWGVIGTGWMTRTHMIDAINSAPGSEVVAILSASIERAQEFGAEFGIPHAYSSFDVMLAEADLDAVFISSTNELHKPQTLAAAAAGVHVLCEKPLAVTVEDALEMVRACEEAGVVLGTNHYRRVKTSVQKVRELIRDGAIGTPIIARATTTFYLDPTQQTWRLNSTASGGGVVMDVAVHEVDMLRYLLDDEVDEVTSTIATSGLLDGHLEDVAVSTLRFRSGVIGSSTVSFCTPGAIGSIEIIGSAGTIFASDLVSDRLGGQIWLRPEGEKMEPVEFGPEVAHYTETIRLFNDAIRGEGAPAVTGMDGARSLNVALTALRSAKSRAAEKVSPL